MLTKKEAIEKLVQICRERDDARNEYNEAGTNPDISDEAWERIGKRWDDLVAEAQDLQAYINHLDAQ